MDELWLVQLHLFLDQAIWPSAFVYSIFNPLFPSVSIVSLGFLLAAYNFFSFLPTWLELFKRRKFSAYSSLFGPYTNFCYN